jgi:hypothetical protein
VFARGLALEQRMRSLARANQIRTARARLKNELAAGHARIEDVLAHPVGYVISSGALDRASELGSRP